MKKIYLLLIAFIIVLTTACSSNKLVCKIKNDELNSKYVITFEGDIVKSYTMSHKKIYQSLDALIELDYYQLLDTYSTLDNVDKFSYKIKENKNDITITIDAKEINYEKNNNLVINKGMTKDQIKNELESSGYVCK